MGWRVGLPTCLVDAEPSVSTLNATYNTIKTLHHSGIGHYSAISVLEGNLLALFLKVSSSVELNVFSTRSAAK